MKLRSLRARTTLLVAAIYLLVGGLTLVAFLAVAKGIVETFGRRFAAMHAELDKNRILGPIHRELALAQKLADSEILRAWTRREQDPATRSLALAELEGYRRLFRDQSWFVVHDASRHYYFNNAQDAFRGRELRYVMDPSDPTMAWYAAAMQHIDTFELHVDRSEQLGVIKVWVNVVMRDGARKVGLAGTGLDVTDFVKGLVQSGEAGVTTLLVDRGGTIQAHPDASVMEYNARMKDEARRIRLQDRVQDAGERSDLVARLARLARSEAGVETFYLHLEGRPYLVAATGLRDLGWVGLTLVDPAQVVGLRAFLPILGILALSFLVTVVLVSLLLNRTILRPLLALTDSTREIAGGNYAIELPETRQDELGQLTTAFNHMSATVRDHTTHLEEKVRDRTQALREANTLLAASNQKLLDSLEVARVLQASLLPEPALLGERLPEHLVVYQPRDQVGGDFYGLFADDQGFLLVVGDCTGHGVSGALMTMTTRAVLDQVIATHGLDRPGLLLGALNRALRQALHQEAPASPEAPDNGLELALVRVQTATRKLKFASARLPLWIRWQQPPVWEELAGDRASVGYRGSDPGHGFTEREVRLGPSDLVVLTTDGLLDQSGGPRGFGMGKDRLQAMLEATLPHPAAEWGDRLRQAIADYQGLSPQRDDITLFAFRLP